MDNNVDHFKIFSLYLRTCYGREQVLSILENLPKLFSRYTSPDTSRKLNTFGNQVTDCLSILSFLDDVPILYWIRLYGLGNKVPFFFIYDNNIIFMKYYEFK
jgi:hypothetical protein